MDLARAHRQRPRAVEALQVSEARREVILRSAPIALYVARVDDFGSTWVSEQIEVGRRSMHAWELDVGMGFRKAYVDPDGMVLRVDLESTPDRPRDRWIRLLFPSEY